MEPFGAFCGTKCTPYLEARQKARSGVKGLNTRALFKKQDEKAFNKSCLLSTHHLCEQVPKTKGH